MRSRPEKNEIIPSTRKQRLARWSIQCKCSHHRKNLCKVLSLNEKKIPKWKIDGLIKNGCITKRCKFICKACLERGALTLLRGSGKFALPTLNCQLWAKKNDDSLKKPIRLSKITLNSEAWISKKYKNGMFWEHTK